jgi:alpha-L-fucosidase
LISARRIGNYITVKSGVDNMIDDNVESYFHTYDAGKKKEFVPDEVYC